MGLEKFAYMGAALALGACGQNTVCRPELTFQQHVERIADSAETSAMYLGAFKAYGLAIRQFDDCSASEIEKAAERFSTLPSYEADDAVGSRERVLDIENTRIFLEMVRSRALEEGRK